MEVIGSSQGTEEKKSNDHKNIIQSTAELAKKNHIISPPLG